MICQRFEAAIRSGVQIDSLDPWLTQVPESLRPQLQSELERHRSEIQDVSIETRVLSSDAVLGQSPSAGSRHDSGAITSRTAVGSCETFRSLSKEACETLQQRFEEVFYPSGTKILRQGEQASGLHLIRRGCVDIMNRTTGRRIDCDGVGCVLGEMSLLMEKPCSADVIATTDVEALVLSAESYRELKAIHPELEIALSQLVSDRLGGRNHDALCGKEINGYLLRRCINRGGMGVVYQAQNLETGEPCALKMLRHRFIYDDQMQGRFDQEAKLLGDLRHPNIISLRENFLAYRTRFLVLDLCDGADLFQLLRRRGPLDEPAVRAVVGQIACGLLYAHECGVIHRDLKPSNVLVDRSGAVKLTDFGLSRLLESEIPGGKAVGTPSYMPPEQFRTDHVGRECDWYALGCLICEMLTAKILFPPIAWKEMYELKRDKIPQFNWPDVSASRELHEVIRGCLQPEPLHRVTDLEYLSSWAASAEWLFSNNANPDDPSVGPAAQVDGG